MSDQQESDLEDHINLACMKSKNTDRNYLTESMGESDDLKQESDHVKSGVNMRIRSAKKCDNNGETTDVNMFASVWVKVEVDDSHQEYASEDETNPFEKKISTKKRKYVKKNLSCDLCNYKTGYKNCLDLHMMSHNSEKPFTCNRCDYATKYPTALHRHMMIKHQEDCNNPEVETFSCDQCDYKTYFKWNLSAHKRKHKMEKQFKCDKCEYATAYRHNYLKHGKTHKDSQGYQCDKCPFATKFEGHITRHLAKIHNIVTDKAFKCETCDFSTKTRWRLNIHRQRSRQENTLSCGYCDFESVYMCEFKKHKVSHYNQIYGSGKVLHNVQDTPNTEISENVEANYDMDTDKDFDYHIDSREAIDTPNNSAQKKYDLDPDCVDWNSIQVLESSDKEKPFQCHMCNYTSRFKASVQRHFQRHHTGSQNRPYKCVNCDFSTKTKDQIALHNKRSKSDIQLFCGLCKFTTNFRCQYAMHQKCHYLHKCTKCNYSCKHKYELQKHFTTIHLGNGHKCQYCDYKAARKESLLCHETIHTGNKPFKCAHCNYTSVRRSLLSNHVRRHHSEIKSDVTVITEEDIQSLKQPILDNMESMAFEMESDQNIA